MKLVLAIIVLLTLAANHPCFAKAAHAQHGSRVGVASNSARAKDAHPVENNSARAKAAHPAESKANRAAEPTIPPPVLPPRGILLCDQLNRRIQGEAHESEASQAGRSHCFATS